MAYPARQRGSEEGMGYDYLPSSGPAPLPSIIPQRGMPGASGEMEPLGDLDAFNKRPGPQVRMGRGGSAGGRPIKSGTPQDEFLAMLQAFFDEFNAPFDPNDPYIKSILDNAQASTLQSAGNAGIFGPYSQSLAQQAYIKSSAGIQGDRQRMAAQALGMIGDYKRDKRNFDYAKSRDALADSRDSWAHEQESNSDLWRGIGGGLGAIGGGILGGIGGAAAGGVGAIPGAIAGASSGWGLGQNLGGAAYQGISGITNPYPRGGF